MSETYARRGAYDRRGDYTRSRGDRTKAGGVIIACVATLATILVIWGLYYAAGTGTRHQAALFAAGCEPALSPKGIQCITWQMEVSQYKTTTSLAVQQLNADAADYTAFETHNLGSAEMALSAEVAAEKSLSNSLAAVSFSTQHEATLVGAIALSESTGGNFPSQVIFTPQMTAVANTLTKDLTTLAKLTTEQARSTSLTELRSFNARVQIAAGAAQADLKLLGKTAATVPTEAQEP
jgi:hypothetical protein